MKVQIESEAHAGDGLRIRLFLAHENTMAWHGLELSHEVLLEMRASTPEQNIQMFLGHLRAALSELCAEWERPKETVVSG